MDLTCEQQSAIEAAVSCVRSRGSLYRIGGYAGTGKTTIAKQIAECGRAAVCAFTGKAASVLRSNGLDGHTIHRTVYDYDPDTERFVKRPFVNAEFFLLDEASMVSKSLWTDMQSYGLPIVAIGDPGQLEPIGDDPRLIEDPDIVLEQIHRQANESAIIEFANHVRKGGAIRHGRKGDVEIAQKASFMDSLDWADQLLCGFNKTRVAANARKRERLGFKKPIEVGERLICLKNDMALGVFNGMMLTVRNVEYHLVDQIGCALETDDGDVLHAPVWSGQLGREKAVSFEVAKTLGGIVIADYGYCTTVHKFQGSEADNVAVIDEQCQVWDPVRWRYTAITRAAKSLRYCI